MFRIAHTSDLGLKNWPWGGTNPKTGLNKGFEDALKAFEYVVDDAIKQKAQHIIIAGDINEERNPEALLIEKFCGQIQRLVSAGIIVIVVVGNHDLDGGFGTSTSVSYLKALKYPNVHVVDLEPEIFESDGVVYHCLPYFTKNQLGHANNKELQAYIDDWMKNVPIEEDKYNIFVSHYSVESSFYGLEIDEIRLKFKLMEKFDYVALGHIHKYEMFGSDGVTGGYCGSPYIKDFGENVEKYYNMLHLSEGVLDIDKRSIPSREFAEIEMDCDDASLEDVLSTLKENFEGELTDKIVKIKLTTKHRFNPKPIYEFLREEKVFHYVPIQWNVIQVDRKLKIEATSEMKDDELVSAYLKSSKVEKSWVPKILNLHGELSGEVRT